MNDVKYQAMIQDFSPKTLSQVFPNQWQANPFHKGEVVIQQQVGVHDKVMSYATKVIRSYLPDQHRHFYQDQPFLVAAARDRNGNMWSTLLMNGKAGFVKSPDPKILVIDGANLSPQDVLYRQIDVGSDIGLLGIEFATRRRNRVNGRIVEISNNGTMTFETDQSFGNCPQYIKPRQWWSMHPSCTHKNDTCSTFTTQFADHLSTEQQAKITAAETVFLATGYRGEGDDARFGNDSSHRGGPAGFVVVEDPTTIVLPEFAGNNHFNTLGNLWMDPRMGLLIPSFEDGGAIQLSGKATIDMDTERAAKMYTGALRLITFHITHVNEIPGGTFPIRWSTKSEAEQRQLKVTSIIQESVDVKSFLLSPAENDNQQLWEFSAGQHLPIRLRANGGELLRSYSLSAGPRAGEYRISVKRELFGKASTFLHDRVAVGDFIQVSRPSGDFRLRPEIISQRNPLVLLSSGIGATPLLSMLHQLVDSGIVDGAKNTVYWIQGVRDGDSHPFRGEVCALQKLSNGRIVAHFSYSKPRSQDVEAGLFHSHGRVTLDLIQQLIGKDELLNAAYFICGGGAFSADLESALQQAGVNSRHIEFESF